MSRLHILLADEKELVSRFLNMLREEQSLLVSGDADSLHAIGLGKLELVELLNRAEASRTDFLSAETPSGKKPEMTEWLKQHPTEKFARQLWSDILELAREARQLHTLNGELINSHLARTAEAIAILTQRQKDQALYGSNGQAAAGTGSRIVDSA